MMPTIRRDAQYRLHSFWCDEWCGPALVVRVSLRCVHCAGQRCYCWYWQVLWCWFVAYSARLLIGRRRGVGASLLGGAGWFDSAGHAAAGIARAYLFANIQPDVNAGWPSTHRRSGCECSSVCSLLAKNPTGRLPEREHYRSDDEATEWLRYGVGYATFPVPNFNCASWVTTAGALDCVSR